MDCYDSTIVESCNDDKILDSYESQGDSRNDEASDSNDSVIASKTKHLCEAPTHTCKSTNQNNPHEVRTLKRYLEWGEVERGATSQFARIPAFKPPPLSQKSD